MNLDELRTLPDTNLHVLLTRGETAEISEEAALELYRRGSPFLHTPEFEPFKPMCIDRELRERRAQHDPARVLDGLQWLHAQHEITETALADLDRAHTEAERAMEARRVTSAAQTADALNALEAQLTQRASSLTQLFTDANNALAAKLAKTSRNLMMWCGGLSLATIVIVILHFAL